MNDEQQLWRDFQKFMNQFMGFQAVAEKIGGIGDIIAWQSAEQHKLDGLRLDVAKQRDAIVSERAEADVAAKRYLEEQAARARDHADGLVAIAKQESLGATTLVAKAKEDAAAFVQQSKNEAAAIISEATDKAKRAADDISNLQKQKTLLQSSITGLEARVESLKQSYAQEDAALSKLKAAHDEFKKKVLGG